MDSSVIQFTVESVIPWLIFSGFVYVCSSYITKNGNTSPSLWWSALAASFLPFIPLSFGFVDIVIPNLNYVNSSLESAQILKQASIAHASLKKIDLIVITLIVSYFCFICLKLIQLMAIWQRLKKLTGSSILIDELSSSRVKVAISSLNHSPFVFGAISPYIVLPKYFSSLEKDQQSILIQHELTHIANKDHIATILWRVLSILLWINPFVRKMEWQFIRAMEYRCDKLTIHRFNINKHDYAKTLLVSLKRSALLDNKNPVAQFNSSVLCTNDYKVRLTNIICPSNKSHFTIALTFSLMIIALFGIYTFLKPPSTTGILIWRHPLDNHTVTSTFSSISKIRHYKPHQGVDYVAERGSSVMSAADGIIVIADNKTLHPNYGNTILIQHKGGYQTLYSHLDSIDTKVGSWIRAGQAIGIIGDTGKATGVHLHFEVIKDNQRIDPSILLNTQS